MGQEETWTGAQASPVTRPSHLGDQQAVCLTSVLVCSVCSVTLSTFPQTLGQSRSALKSKRIMPLTFGEHSTNHEPMFSRTWRHQLLQEQNMEVMLFAASSPLVENIYKYWRCASAVQYNFNWSCPTPAKAIQELHVLSI